MINPLSFITLTYYKQKSYLTNFYIYYYEYLLNKDLNLVSLVLKGAAQSL